MKGLIGLKGVVLVYLGIYLMPSYSQVSLSTTYTTGFGTAAVATWTNNSTFLGWYVNDPTEFQSSINITAAAPSNNGGIYVYTCSGGTDRKLGTRASSGTGTIHYGVRLVNTSGSTINYLDIMYDWFQFSLAQNGSNVNTTTFSYQVGATVTSLTAGAWTNLGALNFTAPQSSATCGGNQINGYPCTQGGSLMACLSVTIAPNEEIMLRWTDVDDGCNDHHMGIDNVFVGIATDNTCAFILPATLSYFNGVADDSHTILKWETESELNLDYFVVEATFEGTQFFELEKISAKGSNGYGALYSYDHEIESATKQIYYRLRIVDRDGIYVYSDLISIDLANKNDVIFENGNIYLNQTNSVHSTLLVNMYDISGVLIYQGVHGNMESFQFSKTGVYILEIPSLQHRQKIVCL